MKNNVIDRQTSKQKCYFRLGSWNHHYLLPLSLLPLPASHGLDHDIIIIYYLCHCCHFQPATAWIMTSSLFITSVTAATSSQPRLGSWHHHYLLPLSLLPLPASHGLDHDIIIIYYLCHCCHFQPATAWIMTSSLFITSVTAATSSQPRLGSWHHHYLLPLSLLPLPASHSLDNDIIIIYYLCHCCHFQPATSAPLYLRQCLDAAAAISCSVIRRCVINWPITTQLTLGRWHRRQQSYQWCRMNENFVHVTAAMSRHPQIVFRCQQ